MKKLLLLFVFAHQTNCASTKPITFINKSGKELLIVQNKSVTPNIQLQQSDSCIGSIGVVPIAQKMNICAKVHDEKETLYSIDVNEAPECIEIYENGWKPGIKPHNTTWTQITITTN